MGLEPMLSGPEPNALSPELKAQIIYILRNSHTITPPYAKEYGPFKEKLVRIVFQTHQKPKTHPTTAAIAI